MYLFFHYDYWFQLKEDLLYDINDSTCITTAYKDLQKLVNFIYPLNEVESSFW